ncbi:glycoside hydrolase family 2 protein [Niastella populi]|uniref:beta-galactosidase n=1 Tax=Niastella populi TaxID=550983 RepID=A0A1V9FKY4_9BACT|nr:glycoside hydrolase family 2 TIM barrel-domain containing protein [Niastella populi]OQP58886.1 hypothetical protein A4R26_22155 [Niastella populi]
MKKTIAFSFFFLVSFCSFAQQTIIRYLSGTDKDNTVAWDFLCTKGRNSGKWQKIPVPSNWEMHGFGTFNYYQDKINPDEKGLYKHKFTVDAAWKGKNVFMVFDGVMTDAAVTINGQPAGPVHQGAFYQFKYNITPLLKYGKQNLLEVKVSKRSANESVNRAERKADFWIFGGIFRPVYLEIVPPVFIERVAIDAKADGQFAMQVFSKGATSSQTIEARVEDLNGKAIGESFSATPSDGVVLRHSFSNIHTWNPEQPNLYNVIVSVKDKGGIVHTIKQRFGFRTAEMKPGDGFYVNGVKVIFKGVNRHSQWPESGRTLSRAIHLMDIGLIKEMNMNAVRMSHYPPDAAFLDLCDSLGLFVLDELTGWQAAYDTITARRLVKELVVRDVNHPSIVLWDNGNEGGWNRAVDNDYALYDPQKRWVIHPWERFNGTDTKHYPEFNLVTNYVLYGADVFFPTEFMHGLFDGGHGAGLDDYWQEMMKHPMTAGGFLWSLHDEGVVRADHHDSIDVAGNQAPDGIVGPHREKEGSFYTIREIWSPIQIALQKLPVDFNGKLPVENRYLYTNLQQCRFNWKLVRFANAADTSQAETIVATGSAAPIDLLPGEKGWLELNMDAGYKNADALYVTAYDAGNREIFTWSWGITSPAQLAAKNNTVTAPVVDFIVKEAGNQFTLTCDGIAYSFNTQNGFLQNVFNGKTNISLGDGPLYTGATQKLTAFNKYRKDKAFVVEPVYKGDELFTVKWTFEPGKLPKLEYGYYVKRETEYTGITFTFPENKITGMRWLGRGPYRVWKNRLKGQLLGIWQKDYNNTITGESWNYPEFKGWHASLYWVTIQNKEADFTIYAANENVFLQMLQPARPVAAGNDNTSPPFPGNTIGFFNNISPIGTKFKPASSLGPQSQKNRPLDGMVHRSILFQF